jgi:transcriptional regulator with XRE-family HTH domain
MDISTCPKCGESNKSNFPHLHCNKAKVTQEVTQILATLKLAGLTLDDVGARMGIGRRLLSSWKHGKELPSLGRMSQLRRLAEDPSAVFPEYPNSARNSSRWPEG